MGKESEVHDNVLLVHCVPEGRNTRRFRYHLVWPQRRISTERHLWTKTRNVVLNLEGNFLNTSDIGSIPLGNLEVRVLCNILFTCFQILGFLVVDFEIYPLELYRPVSGIIGSESMTWNIFFVSTGKGIISFLIDEQSA